MDQQLQAAGDRAGQPRATSGRRRAGLPAKRFFRRFTGFADVPDQDLELLAERLRQSSELGPEPPIPALQAVVRREVAKRKWAGRPEDTEESE